MRFPRASGILLHLTSLPNEYGIGDFGRSAYEFIDFLESTQQTYWQILPLGPTGFGDSPYQCFSAFAGNTNLISPEVLIEDGLLTAAEVAKKPEFIEGKVDYPTTVVWKNELLKKAYSRHRNNPDETTLEALNAFSDRVSDWLDDYALYQAIKGFQDDKPWWKWKTELSQRDTAAIRLFREELSNEIQRQKFYQFLFFKQWANLKSYANAKGVKIIGDLPIFVSLGFGGCLEVSG